MSIWGVLFGCFWGNPCFHSLENKNLSNLLQIGFSCKFDQVKEAFFRGPINSLSLIKSSKSLMLRVNLEPPNFYEILLIRLKSPQTHHFRKVIQKRSWSFSQKSFLIWEVLGPWTKVSQKNPSFSDSNLIVMEKLGQPLSI